jgi:hypothetical protein
MLKIDEVKTFSFADYIFIDPFVDENFEQYFSWTVKLPTWLEIDVLQTSAFGHLSKKGTVEQKFSYF